MSLSLEIENDTFIRSGNNGGGDQLKEQIKPKKEYELNKLIDHIDPNKSDAVNPEKGLKRRSLTLTDLGTRFKHISREVDKIKYEQDVLKQQITDNVKNKAELKEELRKIQENLSQCETKRLSLMLENGKLKTIDIQLKNKTHPTIMYYREQISSFQTNYDELLMDFAHELNYQIQQAELLDKQLKKKLFGPQDQEKRNNNDNNHLTDKPKKKIISTIARISLQIIIHFALMTVPALTPKI